jgi:hypothetical protein
MPESKNTRPRRASAPKKPKTKPSPVEIPQAEWQARDELRRAALSAGFVGAGLDDRERAFLGACQQIYRQDTGSNTPFEEFFRNVVLHVQLTSWPTPDDVEHDLETFRKNFDDMKRDCAAFIKAYPEGFAAELTEVTNAL